MTYMTPPKRKTEEERLQELQERMFQGRVKVAISSVLSMEKPFSIKQLNETINSQRKKVPKDLQLRFNVEVNEGLKEFIKNYFI